MIEMADVQRQVQFRPKFQQPAQQGEQRRRDLAARRAEAIYAVAWDLPAAQAYYRDIKRRVKAAGRHAPVPILPGLVPYVAATVAEAQAKQQELDSLLPVAASLRQLGLFTAQDCMSWELDAPVPPLPSLEAFTGPKGRYSTILRIIATEHPTVRQLLGRLAAGGRQDLWTRPPAGLHEPQPGEGPGAHGQ